MEIGLFILTGLIIGGLLGSYITRLIIQRDYIKKEEYDNLKDDNQKLYIDIASRISKSEITNDYVAKETFDIIKNQLKESEDKIKTKDESIINLNNKLTELQKGEEYLKDKLTTFKKEIEDLHTLSKSQFANLATDILEQKKKIFVDTNKAEMDNILNPLKLDINAFKKTIDDTRKEDIKDLTSLKKEIESLSKLNTQLSDDAQNLANALKADVKVQGNWGEDRLNLILETEGLQKYIDYSSQGSYRDEEQNVSRKPDFILNLPDGKHIVIDSKVSLTAYVNYFNAADTEEKAEYLKLHLKSLMDHIDNLADKNYQSLTGLNTPDYVFLFMPIEGALTLALNSNQDIFNRALKRKIVIITPTTLVATLKIIKIIWSKENQVKNVEEIFKQCGLLHDKFVMFIEEVEKIGSNLDTAKKSFKESMDRLTDGARKGDTIIGRFEKIKELGAKTNKSIPDKYITQIEMLPDNEISIDLETEADIQEIKTNSEIQNE